MKEMIDLAHDILNKSRYDGIALGLIDFKNKKFESFQIARPEDGIHDSNEPIYFDLASVTKPLTMSLSYFLKPEFVTKEMILLMEHRAGIPAWGLLSRDDWRKHLLEFSIKESNTLYSDYSALRYMLEFEKKEKLLPLLKKFWHPEIKFWKELSEERTLINGYRNGCPVKSEVHDPNAFTINDFCTHAGLFSTITGICETLLKWENEFKFIDKTAEEMKKRNYSTRFTWGFDRVENPEQTLAGMGSTQATFGHLGFTGTSFWIDPHKKMGQVILSNATREYWFDKEPLNELRREFGRWAWAQH